MTPCHRKVLRQQKINSLEQLANLRQMARPAK